MQLIHNKRLKPLTRNLHNRYHAEGMAERVKKLVAELKAYCQAKGIRQVQLADELKVSTQWVKRLVHRAKAADRREGIRDSGMVKDQAEAQETQKAKS
jgi:hypothetical protein